MTSAKMKIPGNAPSSPSILVESQAKNIVQSQSALLSKINNCFKPNSAGDRILTHFINIEGKLIDHSHWSKEFVKELDQIDPAPKFKFSRALCVINLLDSLYDESYSTPNFEIKGEGYLNLDWPQNQVGLELDFKQDLEVGVKISTQRQNDHSDFNHCFEMANSETGSRLNLVNKLDELTRLPVGWDGYSGVPTEYANALFAIDLMGAVSKQHFKTPSVVPGGDGSLQLEWHINQYDLEIEILDPHKIIVERTDLTTDENVEIQPDGDYGVLFEWIKELDRTKTANNPKKCLNYGEPSAIVKANAAIAIQR